MSDKPARKVVEKGENFRVFNDGCIRIDNVRASYPHLDKAWAKTEEDTPKFGITGLGLKETHEAAKSACARIINKLIADNNLGKLGSAHKFCRNGDDDGKAEAEGHWMFRASENANKKPTVRDRKNQKITDPAEILELIYPGCVVNILIRPWAQNNKHGKKINANLIAVQFVEDGERFGEGSIDDEDAFDAYEGSDDDFDEDDEI